MYAEKPNRTLVDTQILYALYKKTHWNVRGAPLRSYGAEEMSASEAVLEVL